MEPASKKRRLSKEGASFATDYDNTAANLYEHDDEASRPMLQHAPYTTLPGPSQSPLAGSQAITPFLAKHLPSAMHAPLGQDEDQSASHSAPQTNTGGKYCYRHRLDLKCRRQADEPSIDQLQKDLESLPQDDQQGIAHVWTLFSAAPAKHRNMMLQGILTQCCFPQLSYLATKTRELIKIDFMTALPPELAIKVMCFLDTTSLTKAAQVSQNWRRLADDDVVWHKMCEQHIDRKCTKCGWGLPLMERRRLMESKAQIKRRVASLIHKDLHSPCHTESPDTAPGPETTYSPEKDALIQTRPWKDVYRDRFRVGCNWKHGRFSTKVFRGHTNGVMALQFNEHILVSGSYDSTIKVWDIHTGALLKTLEGHTSGIRCLQLNDNLLLSGSLDKTIRVWDLKTGTLSKTIKVHTDGVLSLHFVGKIFASGSCDKTIRITDFKSRDSFALCGHTDWVNCVRIDEASRTLFSASDDHTVRLWDLDTRKTIRIFAGHVGQVQQVMPMPREFVFDGKLCEAEHLSDGWRSQNGSPDPDTETEADPDATARSYELFQQTGSRAAVPHYMITSSLDGTSRLWDVRSGVCLKTFFGHIEGVWALAVDTLRVVTGAQDRCVKIWDPQSGHCQRNVTGHSGPVTCIGLGDSNMFTGSEDGEVRMYSFADGA